MNPDALKKLLRDLHEQKTSPQEAFEQLKILPYENLDFARIDHHRSIRSGLSEVIFCQGKPVDKIQAIVQKLWQGGHDILATRLDKSSFIDLQPSLPSEAVYSETARALRIQKNGSDRSVGSILILTAGTSDIPIAEEAAFTAEFFGSQVDKLFDVGVAGIHRLLDQVDALRQARVLIVVAGMDGALASVVGGLVDKPVIAVPTSVGYGASFQGLAALLTMLNSCAAGVAAVNIDNGFGAGCIAHKINLLGEIEDTQ